MKRSSACVWLWVLWLLWLVLLPYTFAAIVITGQAGWSRFWGFSSAAISAAAWVNWSLHRRDRLGPMCALIALGMTFGMLADLYGAFRVLRFTEPLVMIIPLFALGHVAYVGGMLVLARRLGLTGRPAAWPRTLAVVLVLYNLAGLALWATLVHPSKSLPDMHVPRPFTQLSFRPRRRRWRRWLVSKGDSSPSQSGVFSFCSVMPSLRSGSSRTTGTTSATCAGSPTASARC